MVDEVIVGRLDCPFCEGGCTGKMCSCSVQVQWDGRTVWVNNQEGLALGRYSTVAGVDIHGTSQQQREGSPCLDCRPGITGSEGWVIFLAGMLKHHRVEVPPEAEPRQQKGLT